MKELVSMVSSYPNLKGGQGWGSLLWEKNYRSRGRRLLEEVSPFSQEPLPN